MEPSTNSGNLVQCQVGDDVDIHIRAVLGNTLLSSVAWMQGLNLAGLYMYDTCIVIPKLDGKFVVLPTARVSSDRPMSVAQGDVETNAETDFSVKGNSNNGTDISWVFWIPVEHDRWLHLAPELDSTG